MSCIPGETSFNLITLRRKYLVVSRLNFEKVKSNYYLKETFLALVNTISFPGSLIFPPPWSERRDERPWERGCDEHSLNILCRTCKKLNHNPSVKSTSLAESIGPRRVTTYTNVLWYKDERKKDQSVRPSIHPSINPSSLDQSWFQSINQSIMFDT